ncbi:LysR family transcriptional regulator [Pseudooceanicola sp. LIPI14-2-Ac024]|uniref:LysR family transcriptional regulator n=1 Tax=Pseudooceanicola sp. LIPI14-2-Ac024 TaxID=3344875 RepID=UPI0035CF5C37
MLYNTLRQYEYLVAVADLGSLTEAARHLNVSQPSLSVAITRVEARLGAPVLVRRKGARVEVTPYGHRLLPRIRALLELATGIEQDTDTPAPFVLGCFEDIAPLHLAGALAALGQRFPDHGFRGAEGRFADLAADLDQGRVDVAITYDVGFAERFDRQVLGHVAPVAFLAPDHPLAHREALALEDLAPHPLIFFSEELSEGFMNTLFQEMRLHPTVGHRVRSLEMMRSLAAHGAGIGISYSCPPGTISYDGRPLVTLPIVTPQAATGIALVWSRLRARDDRFDAVIRALAEVVQVAGPAPG